ncbi:MAG TPA: glycosyl hydrolase family 18 protein [Candidatus Paceibacterota bacterium]|nr:glycosyl hydrolase family 18 protein [Candidatus Paceibacterota bacterium]
MTRVYFFFASLALFIGIALAPSGAEAATRSLWLGHSGSDVRALQTALIAKGHLAPGKATGYFGPLTEAALKKFQCAQAIVCSGTRFTTGYGVYGPKTRAALGGAVEGPPVGTQNPGNLTGKSLTGPWTGPLEFSGWVPDWRASSGTKDVIPNLNKLSSVMPFGYKVSDWGTLIGKDKFSQEPWTSLIAAARAQGVKVVPTVVWLEGGPIHNVLSNQSARIALEDEIAALVKANNFDGIDIDFEAKKHETIDYFSTFLKGLDMRMGDKLIYCTIEARMPLENRFPNGMTIPPDAMDYANDYNALNRYCDRVEIMSYDQGTIDKRLNAARSAPYAPVADPSWVGNLVQLAAQNIAKEKIIIGVPTYGYEYEVTPLLNGGFSYRRLWAFNPNYATQIAAQLGITPRRTSANEMGFTYDPARLAAIAPSGDNSTQLQQAQTTPSTSVVQNLGSQVDTTKPFNYVTWSDAQAIADKVALARELGVRGIAVFSLGGAQDPGMWNVLR